MPMYLDRKTLARNDQAAARARTQPLLDGVQTGYEAATAPEPPTFELPSLETLLGAPQRAAGGVMSAIGAMPGAVSQAMQPAISWALPSLESLGVVPEQPPAPSVTTGAQPYDATITDGRVEPQPSMAPGEVVGEVTAVSGPRSPQTPVHAAGPAPSGDDPWGQKAHAAAVKAGHPNPTEFVEQMRWESGNFAPDVISGARNSTAGARGIAQIMPATAAGWGVNPLDPDAALAAAAKHMTAYYQKYGGDSERALAAYNMGEGNLQKYGPRGLAETNSYIDIINQRTRARGAGGPPNAGGPPAPAVPTRPPAAAVPTPPQAAGGSPDSVTIERVSDGERRTVPRSQVPGWTAEVYPGSGPLWRVVERPVAQQSPLDAARASTGGGDVMSRQALGEPVSSGQDTDYPGAESTQQDAEYPGSGVPGLGQSERRPTRRVLPGASFPIYDSTGMQSQDAEGVDTSLGDFLPIPRPAHPVSPYDLPPGAMYRQPLAAQPELPADEHVDPDAGPREALPGSSGAQPLRIRADTIGTNTQSLGVSPSQAAAEEDAARFAAPRQLPVWDAQGQVIGYRQEDAPPVAPRYPRTWVPPSSSQASNEEEGGYATQQPSPLPYRRTDTDPGGAQQRAEDAMSTPMPPEFTERVQAASVAGLEPGQSLAYAPGSDPRPPVQSTPGEADYVPQPSPFAAGGLLEPGGGGARIQERMEQIGDIAARAAGTHMDPTERVTRRAVRDPAWRAANPALAAEYDALEQQFGLTVMGQAGDASKFSRVQRPTPAIQQALTSDYGRQIERFSAGKLPQTRLGPATDETYADIKQPREVVHPDIRQDMTGPVGIPTSMAGRQNAALPFDPASAAAGGAAGAMSAEEGEEADPIRAGAGAILMGMAGTPQGRRLAQQAARYAAKQAERAKPPNLLEILQAYRHSVAMLGNFSTGLVNAAGGPVEIALGLPEEAIRTGVFRGMPAPVVYETFELGRSMLAAARAYVGTALGFIPQHVRDAPDFRPPLAERMQGPVGKAIGYAIDTPGRINTQAPDALWHTAFTRWGKAREAADMIHEMGVSKLRPDEQIAEMHRILNNPTPEEAERLAAGAKKFADELTYKGEPGFVEEKLGTVFRGGKKPTTSNDPAMQQLWDLGGSLLMPFYGAIFKIHKLAAGRIPGIGMITDTSKSLDQRSARQLVGLGFGLWAADRAAQGLITGPGPSDPEKAKALRDAGIQPESFFVPGVGYLPNQMAGSAGPLLSMIGAYYDAQRYATDKEKASSEKMGERVVKDVLRTFQDFPVVDAVKSVMAMAESPVKGTTDFLSDVVGSLSPAMVRTKAAADDPYMRTTDKDAPFFDQLRQKSINRAGVIPGIGTRQDLPRAQDTFGRDVENPRQGLGAFFTPRVGTPKDDPAVRIFTEAGVDVGQPPKEISLTPAGGRAAPGSGITVPLSPQRQRDWNRYRGELLLDLTKGVEADPTWATKPKDVKEKILESFKTAASSYAGRALQADMAGPELEKLIDEALSARTR